MTVDYSTISRCSKVAFWIGIAAIACGIAGFVIPSTELLLLYLALTLTALITLIVLRLKARRPLNSNWGTAAVVMLCVFFGLSVFLLPVSALLHFAERRTQSVRSLMKITRALSDYHDKHGHLPAASINDGMGKPLLSWRVAILPFLGEEDLYRQFKLDESWDSPWNRALLKRMPAVYQTRLQPGATAPPYTTFYQVFVGPGTAFEPGLKLQLPRDFPDGAANTILVVDAANSVFWSKPEDLIFDPKGPLPALGAFRRDKGRFPWRGGEGSGSIMVGLGDYHVRSVVWPGISEQTLRNAITRNDGQALGNDW